MLSLIMLVGSQVVCVCVCVCLSVYTNVMKMMSEWNPDDKSIDID